MFPLARFSLYTKDNYLNKNLNISFQKDAWTLVFNENILTFKLAGSKTNKENIKVKGLEIIESKNKTMFALKLSHIKLNNMNLIETRIEQFTDNKCLELVKSWSKSEEVPYIIINRDDLTLNEEFKNIENNLKIFKYWSKIHITMVSEMNENVVLEKLDFLPKRIDYIFEVKKWQSRFIQLLKHNKIIKKIKKLGGRLLCKDTYIKLKRIDKKNFNKLIEKFKNIL